MSEATDIYSVRMQLSDAASLGRIRLLPGVEICAGPEEVIWLRFRNLTDTIASAIRSLPGTRYRVLGDGQLVEFDHRVPCGYLPEGPWIELPKWMQVRIEPAALPGRVSERVALRLVRGGATSPANVMVTEFAIWQRYAAAAPQVRLDRWAFAQQGDGQVVIRGTPLPPIDGVRYAEQSGVAVEAGWTWLPRIDHAVLASLLQLESHDLAILYADGSWDHIRGDDFVHATRSAVRLSGQETADSGGPVFHE